ncbi:hypothetical protein QBC39DRAFT_33111 [Podospora conica]|nr:hypothetical protein QBC39DRAFT_33111 [Schizothecium conicum]
MGERETRERRRRRIGQRRGQDKVGVANMGAERGATAALALFFFSASPGRRPPSCLLMKLLDEISTYNGQMGKNGPVKFWQRFHFLLLLHLDLFFCTSACLARHQRQTPTWKPSLFHLPSSASARCNPRQHTRRSTRTHTHAHTHVHTAASLEPVQLRRSSLSNISTTRPSLKAQSLPPTPRWRTKPRGRAKRRGRIRTPCLVHEPTTFPAHTLSRRAQQVQVVGPREGSRAKKTSRCTPQGGPGGCIYRHPLQRLQISKKSGRCGSCGSV